MDDKQLDALLKEGFGEKREVAHSIVSNARRKAAEQQEKREKLSELFLFMSMFIISMVLASLSYHAITLMTGSVRLAIVVAGGAFGMLQIVVVGSLIGNLYYKEIKDRTGEKAYE